MSEDRWVRIVDPEHVLRRDIDEVWYAGDVEEWFPVVCSDGRKLGEVYNGKVRCRLRDVPPGTKIVDTGPYHELVEPWETEPTGGEEWWSQSEREWRKRTGSHLCLGGGYIYRRPIAKPAPKTPQPGEWWFANDMVERLFFHGRNQHGQLICECCSGVCSSIAAEWSSWHHEPACTGWDWQPPQPEPQPEPLTLEQRVEALERQVQELERQVNEWDDSQ